MKQEDKNLQQNSRKESGEHLNQPVQTDSNHKISTPEPDNQEIDRYEGNMDHGELGGNLNSNNKNKNDEQRTGKP